MNPLENCETAEASRTNIRDDNALLTSAQTRALLGGISTMTIWRWLKDAQLAFPTPTVIRGRNYWKSEDIRAWRIAQTGKGARNAA